MSTQAAFNTMSPSGSDGHWRVASTADVPALLLSASRDDERARASIFNHSAGNLYIKLGSGAGLKISGSAFFDLKIASGTLYELPKPIWHGEVWGVWDVAGGWAMINETGDND